MQACNLSCRAVRIFFVFPSPGATWEGCMSSRPQLSARNIVRARYVRKKFLNRFTLDKAQPPFPAERFTGWPQWLLGNDGAEIPGEIRKRIMRSLAPQHRHAEDYARKGAYQSDSSRFHGFPGTTKATRIRTASGRDVCFLYFPRRERMLVAAHFAARAGLPRRPGISQE